MKIYKLSDKIPAAVYGLGIFDGVHTGHASLIHKVRSLAKTMHSKTGLFVFDPPPALYFVPNIENYQLTTIDEKLAELAKYKLDHVVVAPFDDTIKKLTPAKFYEEILRDRLKCKGLVCGTNYHFGNDKHGDSEYLSLLSDGDNIPCEVMPLLKQEEVISSSLIRTHLHNDNLSAASALLGRNYTITGRVIHGKKLGRELGFPTANIETARYKLFPNPGIYKSHVYLNGVQYKGVLHYGITPTVDESGKKHLEVFILDFSGEIYGETITVELLSKVRETKRFDSVDELKLAIQNDIKMCWG